MKTKSFLSYFCALGLFLPPLVHAVPTVLGDLDEDGVLSVLDLYKMIRHSEGTTLLPAGLLPFADLNGDGAVNSVDQDKVVSTILGSDNPASLPLTSVREFNPALGEGGVAVTRETVVHFTQPLALDAVVDTNRFYATYAGKKILSRAELSGDRKKATLFYLEPLPSSARISVTFIGNGINDLLDRALDADADHVPGGIATSSFDTIGLSPVPNTEIRGRVFASEPVGNSGNGTPVDRPLIGVTISVDGAEETLRTVTGADGSFTLSPCPAGEFFVHIDGRTSPSSSYPGGDYYPVVGKKWFAQPGSATNVAGGTGFVYLPKIRAGTLFTVNANSQSVISMPAAAQQQYPSLAGATLTVPSNSLFADDGTRGGSVGLAPVAPSRLPSPLPPGLQLPVVFTIQTDGATNFDRPAALCVPNISDPLLGRPLEPGEKTGLWSFNHDTGEWEISAPMTCTADGKFIKTDPGTGVRQPGWHGWAPCWWVHQPICDRMPCPPRSDRDNRNNNNSNPSVGNPNGGGGGGGGGMALAFATEIQSLVSAAANGRNISTIFQIETALGGIFLRGKKVDPLLISRLAESLQRVPRALSAAEHAALCANVDNLVDSLVELAALNNALGPNEGNWVSEGTNGYDFAKSLQAMLTNPTFLPLGLPNPILESFPESRPTFLSRWTALGAGLAISPEEVTAARAAANRLAAYCATPNPGVLTAQQIADLTLIADFGNGRLLPTINVVVNARAELKRFKDFQASVDSIVTAAAMKLPPMPVQEPYFYAVNIGTEVIRGRASANGGVSAILAPNQDYVRRAYIPRLNMVTSTAGRTGEAGTRGVFATHLAFPKAPGPDADADGLSDEAEFIVGTNPADADSDDDGVSDGDELAAGADALGGQSSATGVIASVPTNGAALDVCADGDLVVTANGTGGVTLFQVNPAGPPVRAAQLTPAGSTVAVSCAGSTIIAVQQEGTAAIIDATLPAEAAISQVVAVGGLPKAVAVAWPRAYVGLGDNSLAVVDLIAGNVVARIPLPGSSLQDLVTLKEALYVLMGDRLVTLRTDLLPPVVTDEDTGGTFAGGSGTFRYRITTGEDTLFTTNVTGFSLWDVSSPSSLNPVALPAFTDTQRGWKQMLPNGSGLGFAVVSPNSTSDGPHDVSLYTLGANDRTPQFLTTYLTPGLARAGALYGGLAYVADSDSGLQVVNYRARDIGNSPPTITLTSNRPLTGSMEEGGLLRLSARTTDDVMVRNVTFYIDGQAAFTDGSYPYDFRVFAPALAAGKTSFTIRARAVDTGGKEAFTPVFTLTLTPDATAPTVVSFQPANNALLPTLRVAQVIFSEPIDVNTLGAGSLVLTGAGVDNLFDTADDIVSFLDASYSFAINTRSAAVTLAAPLSAGRYRLTAQPPLADPAGNVLAAAASAILRVGGLQGQDTDNDGLPDEWETELGLNPAVADSNNNGKPDSQEDFDGDGIPNGIELVFRLSPKLADTDGNGINDGDDDPDGDGLTTRLEVAAGSDPSLADTDGDGWLDGAEFDAGSQPTVAVSTPMTLRGVIQGNEAYGFRPNSVLNYVDVQHFQSTQVIMPLDHYVFKPTTFTTTEERTMFNPNDATGKLQPSSTLSQEQVKVQRSP